MGKSGVTKPANSTNLMPYAGLCHNFVINNEQEKRQIWLVPHVVKHREDSQIVTWRCSLGNVCESLCIYAMAKTKSEKFNDI